MTDQDNASTPSNSESSAPTPTPTLVSASGTDPVTIEIETVAVVSVPIELEAELAISEALDAARADDAAPEFASSIAADGDDSAELPTPGDDLSATADPPIDPFAIAAADSPTSRELSDAIAATRAALESRLDKLSSQFDREVRAEATRERVVDRLHAELQDYKNDLFLKVLRPVFVDLIQLHDDIGKMAESFQPSADASSQRAVDVLRDVQQGIEDALYRQGVEPFPDEAKPGSPFDARRQRAVSTVASDDPELAKKVAARLRKGFQAGDKVIRPEIVSVYALRQ